MGSCPVPERGMPVPAAMTAGTGAESKLPAPRTRCCRGDGRLGELSEATFCEAGPRGQGTVVNSPSSLPMVLN